MAKSGQPQDEDVGFDYNKKHERKESSATTIVEGNRAKIRIRAEKSSREFENRIDESRTLRGESKCENSSRDERLKGILRICLEPRNPGDLLPFICPKNFVVQYFTISRNQPVKFCCGSQCPMTKQEVDSSMKGSGQQPCARGRLKEFEEDKFPGCCNPGKEIHDSPSDSESWDPLVVEVDNSLRGDVKEVNDRRADSSEISENESPKTRKRHAPERTDSEEPWHARCSKFIVNLPVTLSEKLFGPARINATTTVACEALNSNDHDVCTENFPATIECGHRRLVSEESLEDQRKKTSENSTADDRCSCHKDVATETRFPLENGNQVKSLHSRTSRVLLQEEIKSCVTRRKAIPTCVKTLEESFTEFRFTDPLQRTKCSDRIRKLKNTSTSDSSSNWPTVISEKFLRSASSDPRKKLTRCCMTGKKRPAKGRDAVIDDSKRNSKKGRLMLKKYTISQSPEIMEETLCFDVLGAEEEEEEEEKAGKRIENTRNSKLRSEVHVKIGNSHRGENKKKLKAIEERDSDINASRKTLQKMRHKSNRERSIGKLDRKKSRGKLEKNTSTGQIFMSNLIAKLLKGGEKGRDRDGDERLERHCTARNQRGSKPGALRQIRSRNVSQKCGSTSIKKNRNKGMKCPRNATKDSLRNENFRCNVDPRKYLRENQAERKMPRDTTSGRRRSFESKYGVSRSRSSSEEDLENLKNFCRKESRLMTGFEKTKTNKANGAECRICESCGSSRAKSLAKSGVLQSIDADNYCERKSRDLKGEEEEEIRGCQRRDKSESRKRFEDEYEEPEDSETPRSMRGPITCKRNDNMRGSKLRTCERLIVKANEISESATEDRSCEFLAEGLRRTFVIAGENIRVKMLYDRQTSTELIADELSPESMHCQSSKPHENGKKTSRRGVIDGTEGQNFEPKSASSFTEKRPNRTLENQAEKIPAVSQVFKECLMEGRGRENNTSKVSPEEISGREEGEVLSSVVQETRKGRENTVCGSETCLYNKALIKSANVGDEESGPGDVLTRDNPAASPPKVIGEKEEEEEEEKEEEEGEDKTGREIFEHGSEKKTFYMREDLRLPKLQPCETGREKVRVADGFDMKKLKSRNTTNAYYSREKRDACALSRRGMTNDKQGKREKISEERGKSSALDKTVAKVRRKPYQRIVNLEKVADSTVNRIAVKNHVNIEEKKKGILRDKANDDSFSNSAAPLPSGSFAFPRAIICGASVVQKAEMQDPERLETDTPAAKTGENQGQSEEVTKRKPCVSAAKVGKSSNTKLEEDFRKSDPRKNNSGRAISKSEVKDRAKGIQGRKIPRANARSESSNRLERSVDIPEAKSASEESKEFGEENAKVRSSGGSEKNKGGRREDISKLIHSIGTMNTRKLTFDNNKKIRENMKFKSKELGSKTRVGNNKSEESEPSKLSPQINSETEANNPGTTSENLCSGTEMGGRNNVESYNDLQSSVVENCYSNRISAPKDDVSRGSTAATVLRSKLEVLRRQKIVKNNVEKKTMNLKTKTPPNNGRKNNNNETTESSFESNKRDSTKSPITIDDKAISETPVNNYNGGSESTAKRELKEGKHLEAQCAQASDKVSEKKSVAFSECSNLNRNRMNRVADRKFSAKNSSSIKTAKKNPPDSRIPYRCTKNKTDSGPEEERRRKAAPLKAQDESNCIKTASDFANENPAQETIYVNESTDHESDKAESKNGDEDIQFCSANEEKEIARHEYDDVSEKAPFTDSKSWNCGAETICDPLERDFSFTDDLKRFLDQGQEFFTFKRRRIFQQKSSCANGEMSETSQLESKSCHIKTAEADGREVRKSSKTCDENQTKNNPMSSLEKALNTLKTILAKKKSGDKNSAKQEEKQTQGTQIYESAKDCRSSCTSEKSVGSKTLNSNESLTVSISFGSSIFS